MSCCGSCDDGIPCDSTLISNAKNWMKKAVKNPGAFHDYASKHDGLDADGKIKEEWAKKLIGDESIDGHVRRMASLYLTFMKAKK